MYADDNQDLIINFDTATNNGVSTIPWRSVALFPPPNTLGMSGQNKQITQLQAGYQQGGLYQYAPNVSLLHCPGDRRYNSPVYVTPPSLPPGAFAYGSYSGSAGMNGTPYAGVATSIKKQTALAHPSERYLWIEENDPRGENLGSWVMQQAGTAAAGFSDAVMLDSPASWHGSTSTFNFADGHAENHKWQSGLMVAYALNMDPNKYGSGPSFAQAPQDIYFLANGYASQQNP
jgi:prepilin-type processing-associated H-X9-DG protein